MSNMKVPQCSSCIHISVTLTWLTGGFKHVYTSMGMTSWLAISDLVFFIPRLPPEVREVVRVVVVGGGEGVERVRVASIHIINWVLCAVCCIETAGSHGDHQPSRISRPISPGPKSTISVGTPGMLRLVS